MQEIQAKTREYLIGQTGSVTRNFTIVDAKEYPMGEEYWTDLEDIDLDQ